MGAPPKVVPGVTIWGSESCLLTQSTLVCKALTAQDVLWHFYPVMATTCLASVIAGVVLPGMSITDMWEFAKVPACNPVCNPRHLFKKPHGNEVSKKKYEGVHCFDGT